ncbi:VOC family protein [Actinomyces slackii]|nr:VOC family protein [Actinomyces slackii]
MQLIIPHFWMQGTADEAIAFYTEAFAAIGKHSEVTHRSTYPTEGLLDFQRPMAGKTLAATLTIDGFDLGLINAGAEFRPTPCLNIMVTMDPAVMEDAPAAVDRLWAALVEGGEVRMELGAYPFSQRYGWVEDRFGINWQLILTDPEGEPRPFLMPSLLFGPDSRGARQAVDHYLSFFPEARLGRRELYPDNEDLVLFSDFQLGGQWLTAMDSSFPLPFDFTPGSSLMVCASTQEDIDYYWEHLSTVPEAERCGWCQDAFGLSWQVTPAAAELANLGPEQYQALMGMTKIDLAALRR